MVGKDSARNPSRPMPDIPNHFRPLSNSLGYINDLVVCPYNEKHVMKHHKLLRHLMKCEKMKAAEGTKASEVAAGIKGNCEEKESRGALPVGFERCPYDGLHRFRSEEKEKHFRQCKARNLEFVARINAGQNVCDLDSRFAYKVDKDKWIEVADCNILQNK